MPVITHQFFFFEKGPSLALKMGQNFFFGIIWRFHNQKSGLDTLNLYFFLLSSKILTFRTRYRIAKLRSNQVSESIKILFTFLQLRIDLVEVMVQVYIVIIMYISTIVIIMFISTIVIFYYTG